METNTYKNRQILVTGAGGFIASHLIEELVKQGAHVRAFVRYNSRGDPGLLALVPPDVQKEIELVTGDLRDLPTVTHAMKGISLVFHMGALISIPYSYNHPVDVVETNVLGTLNVLQAARTENVARVVHTSTSEVYGTALRVPIDESHPLQGQSPYSASKIGADKLAEAYFCSYDLPVVTLRPFNTYGPRQSARAIIPTIITQVLTGKTLRLGNLKARRDLTYISDTVAGFLAVGQTPGVEGETFNLGTGTEISVGDLANEIISIVNKPVEIEVDASRMRPVKSEVQRLLADNSRARDRLGWQPKVPIREGLTRTIAWIEAHLDRYQPGKYQI